MRGKWTDWRRRTGLCAGMVLACAVASAWARYPYPAEVLEVSGCWTGTQAEVVWGTGMDSGTAGFRVVRLDSGGEVPLHGGWIPADITRPGGDYAVVDADRAENDEAVYRIDELQRDGTILTLGSWTVVFEQPSVEPLAMALLFEPMGMPMGDPEPVVAPAAKVRMASNDVYAVTYEALGAVLGLDASEVADRAAEASLVIRCGGELVAYLADASGQRILFYGWQEKSRYTQYNVFLIEPGALGEGRLMQRLEPGDEPFDPEQTFTGLVDFERDLGSMVEHSGNLRDDLYFWTHVVSGSPTIGERTFPAPLEGYAGGAVKVTVRVAGWNDSPLNPDHQVEVRFNDTLIGVVLFDGLADAQATFTAAADLVLETGNQIKVRGVLLPERISSIFVIQGYSLEYRQDYGLRSGPLEASDGGHGWLTTVGYTDAVVLDVTDPHEPVLVADGVGGLPEGVSWAAGAGTRWVYRERAQIPVLGPVPAGHGGWMRSSGNAVDYVVIAPRAFEEPAQRLADYRESLGLRSAVAFYEDICDQFAYGRSTPEAIRSLLIYAHENWAVAPWMVVLGGWGHYDYYGVMTPAVNHLPSLLGSDSKRLRPVDGLFADLTGNEVPDLAIGRIPAQSVAQFNEYIDKLQAYEGGGFQSNHVHAVFVAGKADDGGDFTATNLALADVVSARYLPLFSTLETQTVAQVHADIMNAFARGDGIIHYTGHGGYQELANADLLHYNMVVDKTNPPVPLFIAMTCLSGRFDMFSMRSLAEALVLNPNGGSLAVFAPSGLSWNNDAALLSEEMYRLHAEEQADTMGVLFMRARQSMGELRDERAEAIRTYNLLGDPAMKLQGGVGGASSSWSSAFAQWRWERFSYEELGDVGIRPDREQFEEYVLTGLPDGLRLTQGVDAASGKVVAGWDWRRRVTDLECRLMMSTNLQAGLWTEVPPEMQVMNREAVDSVFERVEVRIPMESTSIFLRLNVQMRESE